MSEDIAKYRINCNVLDAITGNYRVIMNLKILIQKNLAMLGFNGDKRIKVFSCETNCHDIQQQSVIHL